MALYKQVSKIEFDLFISSFPNKSLELNHNMICEPYRYEYYYEGFLVAMAVTDFGQENNYKIIDSSDKAT